MSTKTKTAVQLEPRVILCETNPYTFLVEVEKLIWPRIFRSGRWAACVSWLAL